MKLQPIQICLRLQITNTIYRKSSLKEWKFFYLNMILFLPTTVKPVCRGHLYIADSIPRRPASFLIGSLKSGHRSLRQVPRSQDSLQCPVKTGFYWLLPNGWLFLNVLINSICSPINSKFHSMITYVAKISKMYLSNNSDFHVYTNVLRWRKK